MDIFRATNYGLLHAIILAPVCVSDSYLQMAAEAAKRSPELIQLLELHQQFASITPYSQVSLSPVSLLRYDNVTPYSKVGLHHTSI